MRPHAVRTRQVLKCGHCMLTHCSSEKRGTRRYGRNTDASRRTLPLHASTGADVLR